jgi:hypothetical protein
MRALVVEIFDSSSQIERTLGFAMVAFAHLEKCGSCSRPALTEGGSTPAPDSAKMRSRKGAMLTYRNPLLAGPTRIRKAGTCLSNSQLLAAPKEGIRVCQEGLDLLLDSSHPLLGFSLLLLLRGCAEDGEHEGADLGAPCVHEEVDARPDERRLRGTVGGWEQVRGEPVGKELRDDGGFGDYLIFEVGVAVFDRGHESALWVLRVLASRFWYGYTFCFMEIGLTYGVDLQVPWLAWLVEVDNDLFIL